MFALLLKGELLPVHVHLQAGVLDILLPKLLADPLQLHSQRAHPLRLILRLVLLELRLGLLQLGLGLLQLGLGLLQPGLGLLQLGSELQTHPLRVLLLLLQLRP